MKADLAFIKYGLVQQAYCSAWTVLRRVKLSGLATVQASGTERRRWCIALLILGLHLLRPGLAAWLCWRQQILET